MQQCFGPLAKQVNSFPNYNGRNQNEGEIITLYSCSSFNPSWKIIEFQVSCIIFWGVLYQSSSRSYNGRRSIAYFRVCRAYFGVQPEHILGCAISIKGSYNGRGSGAGHLAAHEVAAPGNFES